jgi:hypothetical protein
MNCPEPRNLRWRSLIAMLAATVAVVAGGQALAPTRAVAMAAEESPGECDPTTNFWEGLFEEDECEDNGGGSNGGSSGGEVPWDGDSPYLPEGSGGEDSPFLPESHDQGIMDAIQNELEDRDKKLIDHVLGSTKGAGKQPKNPPPKKRRGSRARANHR